MGVVPRLPVETSALALSALFLTFAAVAGCGKGDASVYDAGGRTKEQRAFEAAQQAEAQRHREEWLRTLPRTPVDRAPMLHLSTERMERTVVVPHSRVPIHGGRNLVWCATWQLAWDATCDAVAEPSLALGPPAPTEELTEWNRHAFPHAALDPSCFLARGGPTEDVLPKIRKELMERFKAEMLPIPAVLGPSVMAYGYLRKNLPFAHRFEPRLEPLDFQGNKVRAFGANCGSTKPDMAAALAQVTVVSDTYPGQVVLEFAVKEGTDRLILAMIPPRETLEDTWAWVLNRLDSSGRRPFPPNAGLAVPILNFSLDHRYREILGARILRGPAKDIEVVEARQTVRFSLDEGGADLESHAVMGMGLGTATEYVFDRPFLIALIQKGAKFPYFLLWIENDELLERVK